MKALNKIQVSNLGPLGPLVSLLNNHKYIIYSYVRKFSIFFLGSVFVRVIDLLDCRQIVDIPMGSDCTLLVADLFCFLLLFFFCFVMREISFCLFRTIIRF